MQSQDLTFHILHQPSWYRLIFPTQITSQNELLYKLFEIRSIKLDTVELEHWRVLRANKLEF